MTVVSFSPNFTSVREIYAWERVMIKTYSPSVEGARAIVCMNVSFFLRILLPNNNKQVSSTFVLLRDFLLVFAPSSLISPQRSFLCEWKPIQLFDSSPPSSNVLRWGYLSSFLLPTDCRWRVVSKSRREEGVAYIHKEIGHHHVWVLSQDVYVEEMVYQKSYTKDSLRPYSLRV